MPLLTELENNLGNALAINMPLPTELAGAVRALRPAAEKFRRQIGACGMAARSVESRE